MNTEFAVERQLREELSEVFDAWEPINRDAIKAGDIIEASRLLHFCCCWWHIIYSADLSAASPDVRQMAEDIEAALIHLYPLAYKRLALEKLSLAKSLTSTYCTELLRGYDQLAQGGRTLVSVIHPSLLSDYNAAVA